MEEQHLTCSQLAIPSLWFNCIVPTDTHLSHLFSLVSKGYWKMILFEIIYYLSMERSSSEQDIISIFHSSKFWRKTTLLFSSEVKVFHFFMRYKTIGECKYSTRPIKALVPSADYLRLATWFLSAYAKQTTSWNKIHISNELKHPIYLHECTS